jgi:hypothetical protein
MDKKVLKKATEDTPEPCSGWMFKAVANMTKSSPKACEDVVNWLCSKLENSKSPNVKKKCLNIIRSVASYGDTEFARLIVRHSEEIKKYANYRGPSDPLHGDALNLAVRTAASEAIDAIFERIEHESRPTPTGFNQWQGSSNALGNNIWNDSHSSFANRSVESPTFNRYAGIGSNYNDSFESSSSFRGHIGSMPTSKYQGFGSQPYKSPNEEKDLSRKISEKVTSWIPSKLKLFETEEPNIIGHWDVTSHQGSYSSPSLRDSTNRYQPITTNKYFGGSNDWNDDKNEDNNHKSKKSDTSGLVEQSIVDEYTTATKIKVHPTKQELSSFCNRCTGVNSDLIAQYLDRKLTHSQWQVRLKTLYAIEALIRAKNEAVISYFSENMENVDKQTQTVQDSLRSKASKIMELLSGDNIDEDETPAPKKNSKFKKKSIINFEPTPSIEKNKSKTHNSNGNNNSINLLDPFDDATDLTPHTQSSNNNNESIEDIFQNMDIKPVSNKQTAESSPSQNNSNNNANSNFDKVRNRANSTQNILDQFFSSPAAVIPPNVNTVPPRVKHVLPSPQIVYVPVQSHPYVVYPPQQYPLIRGNNPLVAPSPVVNFNFVEETEPKKEEKDAFDFVKQALK